MIIMMIMMMMMMIKRQVGKGRMFDKQTIFHNLQSQQRGSALMIPTTHLAPSRPWCKANLN